VHPLTLAADKVEEVLSHLMLFYTGLRRISSDVAATYVNDLEAKAVQLNRTRQSVGQAKELLMQKNRMKEMGELLHETWLQKRALSKAVSRPEIDDMYTAARQAGAIGGRSWARAAGASCCWWCRRRSGRRCGPCCTNSSMCLSPLKRRGHRLSSTNQIRWSRRSERLPPGALQG